MAESETAIQLQRETRSSIEVTRNAKGDYQWVVKCYFEQGTYQNQNDEPDYALAVIRDVDAALREQYLQLFTEKSA